MPVGGFINTTGSEQTAVQEETKKRAEECSVFIKRSRHLRYLAAEHKHSSTVLLLAGNDITKSKVTTNKKHNSYKMQLKAKERKNKR